MEPGDAAHVAAQLHEVRRRVELHGDSALAAMVTAADEVAAQWQRQEVNADRCERELQRVREAAAASRRGLGVLLDVINELAAGSPSGDVTPARTSRRAGRRRWFSSGRRTPPSLAPQPLAFAATPTAPPSALATRDDEAVEDSAVRPDPPHEAGAGPGEAFFDPPPDVDLAVRFLGTFRLTVAGVSVDTRSNTKNLRVLKYLLSHRDHGVPKDVLVDLFWPDGDLESVGRNVHQAIYTARKVLRRGAGDAQHILFENGAYWINPELFVWSDVDEFESSVAAGRHAELEGRAAQAIDALSRAERCYEGDYLADSPYEEWALGDRERLRLLYVDVTNRLADLLLASGDVEAAVLVSRRLLRHEPCDDATHRRLIRCYGTTGHRNLVIRQYRAYVACAERLYGLGPSPETTALYESLIAN
jgi:DNA-binding SARP family transcriptional activator